MQHRSHRAPAQDAIENCEGLELLRAFYQAITTVSVLDPTYGSGAFLFAALNILEPLYRRENTGANAASNRSMVPARVGIAFLLHEF